MMIFVNNISNRWKAELIDAKQLSFNCSCSFSVEQKPKDWDSQCFREKETAQYKTQDRHATVLKFLQLQDTITNNNSTTFRGMLPSIASQRQHW